MGLYVYDVRLGVLHCDMEFWYDIGMYTVHLEGLSGWNG